MIFCGIDIGSKVHEMVLMNEEKKTVSKSLRFDESAEGFENCISFLQKKVGKQELTVSFEATGIYYQNVVGHIASSMPGTTFYMLNPLAAKKYNDSLMNRQQDDKISAKVIAKMTIDRYKELYPYKVEPQSVLGVLCTEILEAKKHGTALVNRLHKELQIANPEIKDEYSDIDSSQCIAVLQRYPTAEKLARAKVPALAKVKQNVPYARKVGHVRAETLIENAKRSIASDCTIQRENKIKRLVKQINLNQSVIRECEKEIKESLGDIPESLKPGDLLEEPKSAEEKLQQDFVLINSIDGIGDWGAAALLAFGGDISRFPTFEKLNAFTGTCPRYSRSGINDKVPGTMSKKGSKKLRWLMYMLALSASMHNSIIKKYYKKQLSKGKEKKKALGACMSKLLRLVYGVIKTRRIFDPNYYEKRGVIKGGEIASKA